MSASWVGVVIKIKDWWCRARLQRQIQKSAEKVESVPVGHITPPVKGKTAPQGRKERKVAAKKKSKSVKGAAGTKIPKSFRGSASSRNDYLAGESVSKKKKSR